MAKLEPGSYTVQELLDKAGVDAKEVAAVDYNDDGWDRRRIRVGGVAFDDLDKAVTVPEGAEVVEISVDGEVVGSLDVNTQDVS